MSLSQWEIIQSNASLYVGLDIGNPLVGAGSLRIDNKNLLTTIAAATLRLNNTFADRGFVKGMGRTLLNCDVLASASIYHIGLLAMMSVADVTAASTSCYFAGLQNIAGGSERWEVTKYTNGLLNAGTALGTSGSNLPSAGQTRALEFTWIYDTAQFDGGIALVLKVGTATNFSDLATVISVVDISSPLSASVGEGCIFRHADTTSTSVIALFDTTSLTKYT